MTASTLGSAYAPTGARARKAARWLYISRRQVTIPARGAAPVRTRPKEPPSRAHRLVSLGDPKVEQPNVYRVYLVPSYLTGKPGEGAALEVLGHYLGGGSTSLLYKTLVLD